MREAISLAEIVYAYQQKKNRYFMGVMSDGRTVYLGLAGKKFTPVIGRDKIRNDFGELEEYFDEVQLENCYNELWYDAPVSKAGSPIQVESSPDVLVAHDLFYDAQRNIILPDAFDNLSVYVAGCGVLGLEISLSLLKLGVKNLTISEDSLVGLSEVSSGSFRVFDPNRRRMSAVKEILFDQTKKVVTEGKIDAGIFPKDPDGITRVVINTSSDREGIWEVMKTRPELYLDCQVYGERGVLYCVHGTDRESSIAYEESLMKTGSSDVVYMTKVMAGFVSYAIKKYVLSNPFERSLENIYYVDMRTLFRE